MMFKDPIMEALFKKICSKNKTFHLINRQKIIGHSLAIGKPGYGKTSCNRREVELRVESNHKIFCLYDAGRMDMAYFAIPSDADLWKKIPVEMRMTAKGEVIGPKAYKTELLYPVTKKIPKDIPNNGVPFTIAVSDLDDSDIAALVGFESKGTVKGMLSYMERYVDESTTPDDYVNIMASALKKVNTTDGIKPHWQSAKKLKYDVFQPLLNEGLLSSKKARTALNIEKLIKDRKTISVLVLRHCPPNLWGFLVHYFMNHIFQSLSGISGTKRINIQTTIVLNEVADLLRNANDDEGASGAAISRLIEKIAKQSRSAGGLFMLLDTQIPQELPAIRNIMSQVYVFNSSMSEITKAMEIMGLSMRTGMITNDHLNIIPFLPRGFYFLFSKDGISLHWLVWTRSKTFIDGEDFYDVYEKQYGRASYQNIEPILKELEKEKLESEKAWELKRDLLAGNIEDEEVLEEDTPEEPEFIDTAPKKKSKEIKSKIKEKSKKVQEPLEKKDINTSIDIEDDIEEPVRIEDGILEPEEMVEVIPEEKPETQPLPEGIKPEVQPESIPEGKLEEMPEEMPAENPIAPEPVPKKEIRKPKKIDWSQAKHILHTL